MKKLLVLLICASFLLTGASCKKEGKKTAKNDSVVTDTTPVESEILSEDGTDITVSEGSVLIYCPDSNYMKIEPKTVSFSGDALDLVDLLAEKGAFPADVKADDYVITEDILYINLNSAFGEYVKLGSTTEYFGVGCLVNTLISFYQKDGVTKVQFTVDGDYLETGHSVFDSPVAFYE